MERQGWIFTGTIDCFGIDPEDRDKLLEKWQAHAQETGGELQVAALENLLDTDRYEIHALWGRDARPFADYAWCLAQLLPEDHPKMVIQGYDRENFLREDIIIKDQEIYILPYTWEALDRLEYHPAELAV